MRNVSDNSQKNAHRAHTETTRLKCNEQKTTQRRQTVHKKKQNTHIECNRKKIEKNATKTAMNELE